jgi:hypothetical protein
MILLFLLLVAISCSGEVVSELPKEYHGGIIRGKATQIVNRNLTDRREYYLSIMTRDSTLRGLRVPLIFYESYTKGDTIK